VGPALNLLQWNPHWQCFEWNRNNCREEFHKSLSAQLETADIDFANIVELNDDRSRLPARWKAMHHMCGIDRTTLIYNADRWSVPSLRASGRTGCMAHKDRPFIVQQFTEAAAWGGERKVVVVGAHYPHTKERKALASALRAVVHATGEQSVVFLADTNEANITSNEQVFLDIEAPDGTLRSSELQNTCCLNNDFRYEMTYDRIIANFGVDIVTTVLFDDPPRWAQGEFHKPIRSTLVERHTKTSTTTTTTRTQSSTTTTTVSSTTTTSRTTTTSTVTSSTTATTTTTTTATPLLFAVASVGVVSTCAVAFSVLVGVIACKLISKFSRKHVGSATSEVMLAPNDLRTVPMPIE